MALIWTHAQRLNLPRPRRDMLMLATVSVMAVAFAYAHHGARPYDGQPSRPDTKDQVWTGQLEAAMIPSGAGPAEALSSASLVVPKAQLALPPAPPKPKPHVKAVCDSADTECIPRSPAPAPAAAPHKIVAVQDRIAVAGTDLPPRPPGLIPEPPRDAKIAKTGRPSEHAAQNHRSIFASAGRSFAAIGRAVVNWTKSL